MKRRFPSPKRTVFMRLFITLMVMMIIMYTIGYWIYRNGSNTLRDKIIKSDISHLNYYVESLEGEIKGIKNKLYNFIADDNLYKLSLDTDYISDIDLLEASFRLSQQSKSMIDNSKYVDNVYFFIPSTDIMIEGVTQKTINDELYEVMKKVTLSSEAQIIHYKGKMYLSAAHPLSVVYESYIDPKYVVSIELSTRAFEDSLLQFGESSEMGSALVFSDFDKTITNLPDEALGQLLHSINANIKDSQQGYFSIQEGRSTTNYSYVVSDYLGITLAKYESNTAFKSLRQFQLQFMFFFVITVMLIAIYSLYVYRAIQVPLSLLISSFQAIENGDMKISIQHKQENEFSDLYRHFNKMVRYLDNLIHQNYEQKILTQKAELIQLQSQISPHFLYNSFFILQSMIESEDLDGAKVFTNQLGTYFRFITKSDSDFVKLETEADHAIIYGQIMARRFRNRITFESTELPEDLKNMKVPRLIIQPLIENAFEHGLNKKKMDGYITLSFESYEDGFSIKVKDNGGKETVESVERLQLAVEKNSDMSGTALVNIKRRLNLKYGDFGKLFFELNEEKGLSIIIYIGERDGK